MLPTSVHSTQPHSNKSRRKVSHLEGYTPVAHTLLCQPSRLSQGAMLTYLTICTFDYEQGGERKGYVFPSSQVLSNMRGVSERTIRSHIAQLVRGGFLTRVRRRNRSSVLSITRHQEQTAKDASQRAKRERHIGAISNKEEKKKENKTTNTVVGVDGDIFEKLVRIGINETAARRFVQQYERGYLEGKLALLEQQIHNTRFGSKVRNPAAWLVQAIERNYQVSARSDQPVHPPQPQLSLDDYELVVDDNGYEHFRPRVTTPASQAPEVPPPTTTAPTHQQEEYEMIVDDNGYEILRPLASDTGEKRRGEVSRVEPLLVGEQQYKFHGIFHASPESVACTSETIRNQAPFPVPAVTVCAMTPGRQTWWPVNSCTGLQSVEKIRHPSSGSSGQMPFSRPYTTFHGHHFS